MPDRGNRSAWRSHTAWPCRRSRRARRTSERQSSIVRPAAPGAGRRAVRTVPRSQQERFFRRRRQFHQARHDRRVVVCKMQERLDVATALERCVSCGLGDCDIQSGASQGPRSTQRVRGCPENQCVQCGLPWLARGHFATGLRQSIRAVLHASTRCATRLIRGAVYTVVRGMSTPCLGVLQPDAPWV